MNRETWKRIGAGIFLLLALGCMIPEPYKEHDPGANGENSILHFRPSHNPYRTFEPLAVGAHERLRLFGPYQYSTADFDSPVFATFHLQEIESDRPDVLTVTVVDEYAQVVVEGHAAGHARITARGHTEYDSELIPVEDSYTVEVAEMARFELGYGSTREGQVVTPGRRVIIRGYGYDREERLLHGVHAAPPIVIEPPGALIVQPCRPSEEHAICFEVGSTPTVATVRSLIGDSELTIPIALYTESGAIYPVRDP